MDGIPVTGQQNPPPTTDTTTSPTVDPNAVALSSGKTQAQQMNDDWTALVAKRSAEKSQDKTTQDGINIIAEDQADLGKLTDDAANLKATIDQLSSQENLTTDQKTELSQLKDQYSTVMYGSQANPATGEPAQPGIITLQQNISEDYSAWISANPASTDVAAPPASQVSIPTPSPTAPNSTDKPNLFLAAGMMVIMMRVTLSLIHQEIENKDVERQVKQMGFKSVMAFGNAAAESAYSKDMYEADKLFAQATTSFIQAGMTGLFAAKTLSKAGSMKEEVLNDQKALQDNPEYNTARYKAENGIDPKTKLPPAQEMVAKDENTLGSKPLRYDLVDAKGNPIKPGVQQIQERIDYLKKHVDDPPPAGTTISAADHKAQNEEDIKQLQTRDLPHAEDAYKNFNPKYQLLQKMQSDTNYTMINQMSQMMQTVMGAISSTLQAGYQVMIASQDANQIMAQTAMDVSNKYLQSAMDDFSGETRTIQTQIQTIMDAQQKNTEWGNLRA